MAGQNDFDPMKAWTQFVSKWEQEINEFSAKMSASKQFGGALNKASTASRAVQQSFSEQMEKVLKSMNLPSQSQIRELSEHIQTLDDKLDRIAIAVAELKKGDAAALPSAPVRRTRQPPVSE